MESQDEIGQPSLNEVVILVEQQNLNSQGADPKGNPPSGDQFQGLPTPKAKANLRRLSFSKPKSRLFEQIHTRKSVNEHEEISQIISSQNYVNSSNEDDDDDEDFEEDDDGAGYSKRKRDKVKFSWKTLVEWVLFLIILTCLICSITISSYKHKVIWGVEAWKWWIMVMVVFSGRLVSSWVVVFLVFLIERNFMLREKVVYFVYGLRKSIQNCAWLGLVLLSWTFMFNPSVHKNDKMLKKIFQALVAVLVGATIWLVKTVLVKTLASSFHVETYFDRMKESVFHHYILEALSGPPMDEEMTRRNLSSSKSLQTSWKDEGNFHKTRNFGSRKIDVEKLRKLGMESRASAWTVRRLVNYIMSSGLSTISKTVDSFGAAAEGVISSEWDARNCANRIFKNVAKSGAKYIEEEDLMRFLNRVEIHTILPMFEGALEVGRITKSSFRNWVVQAYVERKLLAHSLNDTKTAVQQLHKLASAIACVVIIVASVMVMGFATSSIVVLVTTQLLLLGFMFQNTCKTIFESIIFVFVMHPFDIGDRCVIDGTQMIVEEMNILSTVFLRYDMEKIYYPNSVLLTKPISNFRRSPEMGDAISFTIDMSTPVETITALKKAIQVYVESKPKHWSPKHSVIVKEIEDLNKMKMALCLQHTINHQNYGERTSRITEAIFELKKIFETLGIKYHLPPQEIHVTQFNVSHI